MFLIHSNVDTDALAVSSVNLTPKHRMIMGTGPAGLTVAYELVVRQQVGVTVLEEDPRYIGSISRTVEHDSYRFPRSVNINAEYHEGTRDAEETSGRLVPQRPIAQKDKRT